MSKKAILVLEDGSVYEGHSFGADVQGFSPVELRRQIERDGVALDLESGCLDAMPGIEPLADKGFKGDGQ